MSAAPADACGVAQSRVAFQLAPLTVGKNARSATAGAHSVGPNIRMLIDRADEPYCFRLQKDRVYYVRCALTPRRASPQAIRQVSRAALARERRPTRGTTAP